MVKQKQIKHNSEQASKQARGAGVVKHFKQAPLPFIGQKRMFLNPFKQVLNEHISGDGEGWTIIDVFGGSGLLAHVAKRLKPAARVIYNDFDGYAERLAHIDDTNHLRREIYQLVNAELLKKQRLTKELKAAVLDKVAQFDGYKDLQCLSAWLLFSGQQVGSMGDLSSKDFWNKVRESDYPSAEGYLDGLEVVRESFHSLVPRFAGQDKVLLLLDPPYLCTHQESYRQETYFDLIDFLRLIHLVKPPYVFFSSTKSEFIRFIDATIADKWDNWQAFDGYKRIVVNARIGASRAYEDNMVYKF